MKKVAKAVDKNAKKGWKEVDKKAKQDWKAVDKSAKKTGKRLARISRKKPRIDRSIWLEHDHSIGPLSPHPFSSLRN